MRIFFAAGRYRGEMDRRASRHTNLPVSRGQAKIGIVSSVDTHTCEKPCLSFKRSYHKTVYVVTRDQSAKNGRDSIEYKFCRLLSAHNCFEYRKRRERSRAVRMRSRKFTTHSGPHFRKRRPK